MGRITPPEGYSADRGLFREHLKYRMLLQNIYSLNVKD